MYSNVTMIWCQNSPGRCRKLCLQISIWSPHNVISLNYLCRATCSLNTKWFLYIRSWFLCVAEWPAINSSRQHPLHHGVSSSEIQQWAVGTSLHAYTKGKVRPTLRGSSFVFQVEMYSLSFWLWGLGNLYLKAGFKDINVAL